ncbi:hypothetical protein [Ferrimonas kyonanensis]|uniref:hypothetical protein n=1 Tax=Ferrimonas kyonanensis TaxID=364763 RepID=UPI000419ABFB|nr:hypothetical protein [Ferrimonas kyonanensis]
MTSISNRHRRQLQWAHLFAILVFVASWLYWPLSGLLIPFALWCLFAWLRNQSEPLKAGYLSVLKTLGVYVSFNLLAVAALMLAAQHNRGGLFSGSGANDFMLLIVYGLSGLLLALVGTVWALVRLVKGFQRLREPQEQQS